MSLAPADGVRHFFYGNEYQNSLPYAGTIDAEDEDKLVVRRAVGINWYSEDLLVWFIPAESGDFNDSFNMDRWANENSLWLVYNRDKREWCTWELPADVNAHLGMEMSGDELYFLSSQDGDANNFSVNFVWKFLRGDSIYHYADNTEPISWEVRPQWEDGGDPGSFKKCVGVHLYAVEDDSFIGEFTITVTEYRNFGSTIYTSADRVFSANSDKEKIIKPIAGKVRANTFAFTNAELHEAPFLSGWDVAYRFPYAQEMRDKKGDG
jgi:hypothetical protein